MPVGFGATTQGWRPISVKIQPKALATNGRGIMAMAVRRIQRFLGSRRPPRVIHQAPTAPKEARAPKPIIARKLQ